jgi:hypothetical protein
MDNTPEGRQGAAQIQVTWLRTGACQIHFNLTSDLQRALMSRGPIAQRVPMAIALRGPIALEDVSKTSVKGNFGGTRPISEGTTAIGLGALAYVEA